MWESGGPSRAVDEISLWPGKAHFFPLTQEAVVVLGLWNGTASRLALKSKSSDNAAYRLASIFVFAEPGATAAIPLARRAGPSDKADKLVVQWVKVDADAMDPAKEWKGRRAEGQLSVALFPAAAPLTSLRDFAADLPKAMPDLTIGD